MVVCLNLQVLWLCPMVEHILQRPLVASKSLIICCCSCLEDFSHFPYEVILLLGFILPSADFHVWPRPAHTSQFLNVVCLLLEAPDPCLDPLIVVPDPPVLFWELPAVDAS